MIITFLFDSGFIWGVCVTTAYALSAFTSLSILWIFFIIQMFNLIKAIGGSILVNKGIWIKNIVDEHA